MSDDLDLIGRLREICGDAAAEIERLREDNVQLSKAGVALITEKDKLAYELENCNDRIQQLSSRLAVARVDVIRLQAALYEKGPGVTDGPVIPASTALKLVTDPNEHQQEPRETNIIRLHMGGSEMPLDPDVVLQAAIGKLDGVILVGYSKGDKHNRSAKDEYFVSSIAAGDTAVWLLERCKHKLINYADEPWDGADDNPLPPVA